MNFYNPVNLKHIEMDLSNVEPYESRSDTLLSALGEGFSYATPKAMSTEYKVATLVDESTNADPILLEKEQERRSNPLLRYPGSSYDLEVQQEKALPQYKDTESLASKFIEDGKILNPNFKVPDTGITYERATILNDNLNDKEERQRILDNSKPGLLSAGIKVTGTIAGALADPYNFIPIAGGLSKAKAGASLLSKAGKGALEGALSTAAVDSQVIPSMMEYDSTVDTGDAIVDIVIGAGLGAFLGPLASKLGSRKLANRTQEALVRAASDIDNDLPVDVSGIMGDIPDLDNSVRSTPTTPLDVSTPIITSNIMEEIQSLRNNPSIPRELFDTIDSNRIAVEALDREILAYDVATQCLLGN